VTWLDWIEEKVVGTSLCRDGHPAKEPKPEDASTGGGAAQIGVNKTCVFNWEVNTSNPEIRYMPTIIRFLGYNPCRRRRRSGNGWSGTGRR
jgi:hypothetical protein